MPVSPAFFKLFPSTVSPAQNPSAAPEQALQDVECSCLWIAKGDSGINCLRFYSDRKVISVPTTGFSPQLLAWSKKPYTTWGTYHVSGSSIKFYVMDSSNTYLYEGALEGSSMQLNEFVPEINYRGVHRFELFVFGTASDPAPSAIQQSSVPANPTAAKDKPPQLQLAVNHIAVAASFPAYFGGRSNISPPDPLAPTAASTSNSVPKLPAFTLGELTCPTNLLKITCSVTNTSQDPGSFQIGDIQLAIGPYLFHDFLAVGHDTNLCAVDQVYRKTVRDQYVVVPPATTKVLSFAIPLLDAAFSGGELILAKTKSVPFVLPGPPTETPEARSRASAPHALISRLAGWFGGK